MLHRGVAVTAKPVLVAQLRLRIGGALVVPRGQQLVLGLLEDLEVGLPEERKRLSEPEEQRTSCVALAEQLERNPEVANGGVIRIQRERAVAGVGQRRPGVGREGLGAPPAASINSRALR